MNKLLALVLLLIAFCSAQNATTSLKPILFDLPSEPMFLRALNLLDRDLLVIGMQAGNILILPNWQNVGVDTAPASANHTVDAQGFTFVPASITIKQGDCVTWTNLISHNVARVPTVDAMARDPSMNEGDFYSGGTRNEEYTNCFNTPGTFYYICEPHVAMGMRGEVIVEPAGTQATASPTELVSNEGVDRLLGMSFHTDFDMNNLFYTLVQVTDATLGKMMVLREYTMAVASSISSESNATDVSYSSTLTREIIRIALPVELEMNNINNLLSWPAAEGLPMIFISMKDMDTTSMAQDLDSFFGKILLVMLEGNLTCGVPVNSFTSLGTSCPEFVNSLGLFAYGLRDPSGMFISTDAFIPMDQLDGDFKTNFFFVDGGTSSSEINFGNLPNDSLAGVGPLNYGWNVIQGFTCNANATNDANVLNRTAVLPLVDVPLTAIGNEMLASPLISGFVYRGLDMNLTGLYIFGRYLSNELHFIPGFTQLERYNFVDRLVALGQCTQETSTLQIQSMIANESAQIVSLGTNLDHFIILLGVRMSDAAAANETFTYSVYRLDFA